MQCWWIVFLDQFKMDKEQRLRNNIGLVDGISEGQFITSDVTPSTNDRQKMDSALVPARITTCNLCAWKWKGEFQSSIK